MLSCTEGLKTQSCSFCVAVGHGNDMGTDGLPCSGNYATVHFSSANSINDLRFTFITVINTLDVFRAVAQTTITVLLPVTQLLLPCLRTFKFTVLRTSGWAL